MFLNEFSRLPSKRVSQNNNNYRSRRPTRRLIFSDGKINIADFGKTERARDSGRPMLHIFNDDCRQRRRIIISQYLLPLLLLLFPWWANDFRKFSFVQDNNIRRRRLFETRAEFDRTRVMHVISETNAFDTTKHVKVKLNLERCDVETGARGGRGLIEL